MRRLWALDIRSDVADFVPLALLELNLKPDKPIESKIRLITPRMGTIDHRSQGYFFGFEMEIGMVENANTLDVKRRFVLEA
ncbi:hypothetical protein CEXT_540391 [Caerostris extrusa]|uniref:Uncharacterized protein n=1 Tax=Caerostris extrusa TaxID=172846 RepID=A0AAV4VPA3_CAEEX|nr:hypothetical protein CEXT_540391 [Caerostris extrusa]